jgi:acyl transferase domain-containing protein/NAD(P)H-dependent flavin oxidoreductase YrpB (nitropropane dioxygenase family)
VSTHSRELVVGVTPFGRPDPAVVVGLVRAGALGILDLGDERTVAAHAVAEVQRWEQRPFGVRVGPGCPLGPDDLPTQVDTVLLHDPTVAAATSHWGGRRVLIEVRSKGEARAAVTAGADGLVAKGSESGGRIGERSAFMLLQQLLAEPGIAGEVPVWAQGGIGLHTAAAAVAGGARGVVLDSQLALVRESSLTDEVQAAVGAMDGSETAVVGGHRIYVRPDLPSASLDPDLSVDEVTARLGADDLHEQLLPVGQEGAFAGWLAERFGTAGGVVQGVRAAIAEDRAQAERDRALAPGSALAADHGLGYPVAQGPMTRVSDRAPFAASVSAAGGLPFLALALMTGDEVRALLDETAQLLGDRPWGVGILGFVPPEVRDAQLEVVLDVKPPVALIAGGRPSQATPLEEAGIATYLHVPSPGLLDRFVKDGARRFVFEGRECGGHVGPRSSFTLWETQVERLLAAADAGLDLATVSVLFAGGVHDERSSAMVATLAAPLTARGARIGVLMGTAYLFTAEAVAGGAILPAFQQEAVGCEDTVLLETSPGHATRCAETDYVRDFRAEKQRLVDAGASKDEMWAELEQLNLGRLRIASKGVVREGSELRAADEAEQRQHGMYMIGDVASLQADVVPVRTLHERVTAGATTFLAADAPQVEVVGERRPEPLEVAIVGMAGFFPGAGDLDRFWANVVGGVDSVTEVPARRWSAERYYDEGAFTVDAGKKTPSKWGGFLPEIPFDALGYGIPPASLAAIEPSQLLSLEAAARALDDAGYATRAFDRSRVSVVFGAEGGTDLATAYGFRSLWQTYVGEMPEALDEFLPEFTEDSFPGLLTNVIAGRIANRLDLGGSNYTVDAACAASLAALSLACRDLEAGASDVVLCGGADLHNGINDYLLFSSVHALSPSGRCRTFDAESDGIALGEGIACVALKRLEDAERDGDRVYAVIRGIAGSSDGRHLGLTAPRKEGQQLAVRRAYAQAGVSPGEVGLVEAHGTGTVVGDRTELATLTEIFTEAGAGVGGATVGSVKSQIGHTKCAAGLAGLVKVAKAVHHGVRPATLHVEQPTPYYDATSSPFRFEAGARPWSDERRIAGLSAFGFGGTNFHAVVESYGGAPEPEHGLEEWPSELFLFRGEDLAAAHAGVERLAALASPADDRLVPRLRDLARTAAEGRGPVQVALVASDVEDLRTKLAQASAGEADGKAVFVADLASPTYGGEVAFLFPGQGSQRPGMLADLFVAFPRLRRLLRSGDRWADTLFPPAAFTKDERDAQQDAITDTRVAQPTLGIAGLAMFDVLSSVGVRPDRLAGHSYGELVALAAAGALGEDDLLTLSEARADAILGAAGEDPGAMAAVSGAADDVRAALGEGSPVVVANDNSPSQAVISGPTADVEAALERLGEAGLRAKRIPVACAFHSPVVAGAVQTFGARLAEADLHVPGREVWANTTAAPYPTDVEGLRATLAGQVGEGVRFREQVVAMHEAGTRIFVEVGPGRVLTQLVGKNLGDRPFVAIATDASGDPGIPRLLAALAALAVQGVAVDPTALFAGRGTQVLRADRLVARPRWTVDGHLVKTLDGQVVAGSLRPSDEVPPVTVGGAVAGPVGARDEAVAEYLRGTRELIAAQRDVLLSYLGGPVAAPTVIGDVVPMAGVAPAAMRPAQVLEVAGAEVPVAAAADASSLTPEQLLGAVLQIVSDRTGYPLEMLDPDLDLEADLSIDSIKRIEIVGELADTVGLPGADGDGALDESVVEELAQLKSLRGIVDWIVALGDGAEPVAEPASAVGQEPAQEQEQDPEPAAVAMPERLQRYVPVLVGIDPAEVAVPDLAGTTVAVVDDGRGVALELASRLEADGAQVRLLRNGDPAGDAAVLVDLALLAPGDPMPLVKRFTRLRDAVLGGTTSVLVATPLGGRFALAAEPGEEPALPDGDPLRGTGMRGMAKSLRREAPEVRVRVVDLDPKDDAVLLAAHVYEELFATDDRVEVGRRGAERCTVSLAHAELDDALRTPPLDADSVVVLTGGARGITAKVAVGLAAASGCHLVLVGRSPLPDAEPEDLAGAADAAAVRKALIDRGLTDLAAIEALVARTLADREIRATLVALEELAASVTYQQADVRDATALAAVLADVRTRHGHLDGVVHGAGVLEDRFLRDKEPDSFDRVVGTKLDGAGALVAGLGPDTRFLVLFASIAGVFGNRGQVDYATANDALDTLAHRLAPAVDARVLAVDWGPWAGGGMVSAELEREYERRGVGLVDPGEGVAALLSELAAPAGDPQVVLMQAHPDALT